MTDPTELYELLHVGIYLKHSDAFLVFHDGTQFTNHSLEPNSKAVMPTSKDYTQMISYALKDIKAGEEIFENYEGYLSFEAEWLIKLMEKYNPGCLEFEKEVRNSLEERLQS
jgi:SET domain-containing protein